MLFVSNIKQLAISIVAHADDHLIPMTKRSPLESLGRRIQSANSSFIIFPFHAAFPLPLGSSPECFGLDLIGPVASITVTQVSFASSERCR